MSIFSKPEVVEAVLPFKVIEPTEEDYEACAVDIEAYGRIGEVYQFYYVTLGFKEKDYDELVEILKETEDKNVKLIAKVKSGNVKSFKVDFKYLAETFNDMRFEKGEVYGYGINDKGVVERM